MRAICEVAYSVGSMNHVHDLLIPNMQSRKFIAYQIPKVLSYATLMEFAKGFILNWHLQLDLQKILFSFGILILSLILIISTIAQFFFLASWDD